MDRSLEERETRTYPSPRLPEGDRSLGELFADLTSDLSTLIRKEIELARTETLEKVSAAGRNIALMVAGGLVAYAGVITLVIALAIGLGAWMPYWLSALIVGALVLIIGIMLALAGRSALQQMSVTPEKTIRTLKDNTEWVKEQIQ